MEDLKNLCVSGRHLKGKVDGKQRRHTRNRGINQQSTRNCRHETVATETIVVYTDAMLPTHFIDPFSSGTIKLKAFRRDKHETKKKYEKIEEDFTTIRYIIL